MSTTVQQAVEARIAEALVEFGAEADKLRPDATLESLDIDSLDLFELSQILKQEFGLEVNPEDFEGIETLGQAQAVLLGYVTS
jgi:acyl carrier protein